MVKLFEEEIHIMQLFYANQSIRNVRDISNATHDRPTPSIGTIFNIIYCVRYRWLHSNSQCIDLCFLKLNIGKKYGLCSELKKCPGIMAEEENLDIKSEIEEAYQTGCHFLIPSKSK
jgi:hypothetical protein